MATIRERTPGVWEIRVYVGRDPVTAKPRQASRVVHAGRPTKTGEPPKAVKVEAARLESEAAEGKLGGTGAAGKVGGTGATLALLLGRYFDHLDRRDRSPTTMAAYRRYARLYLLPVEMSENGRSAGDSGAHAKGTNRPALTELGFPALGIRPLRNLTAQDLDTLYDAMVDAGVVSACTSNEPTRCTND